MEFMELMKEYLTIDNILTVVGGVAVIMTGVPVPKSGTALFRFYNLVKYLGANFGHADHTKK